MVRHLVVRGNLDQLGDEGAWAGLPLLSFDKAESRFRNHGITHGYRKVGLPFRVLLRSALTWHNETLNVWTHLLPGLLFLFYMAPHVYQERNFPSDTSGVDRWLITFYCVAAACTFLVSATYHLFGPYSLRAFAILHRLDLAGIQLLITASYIPALFFAFRCYPFLRSLYLGVTISVFAFAVICLPILDYRGLVTVRNLLFLAATAWGLIPTFHYLLKGGRNGHSFLVGVAQMYACYAVGFFFFASKYPERYASGQFNFAGHSHQLWHVAVVVAAGLWLRSLLFFRDIMGPELCVE